MKVNMQSYPILKQLKRATPYFLLNPAERSKFSSHLGMAEEVIKSQPTVEYLCNSLLGKLKSMSQQNIGVKLYDTEGVLLSGGFTLLYRVEKKDNGTALLEVVVVNKVEVLAIVKAVAECSKINLTVVTLGQGEPTLQVLANDLIAFLLFKKYVAVQEKEVSSALASNNVLRGSSSITDLAYPVDIYNELYYTSVIRDAPFSVSSHVRRYKSGKVVVINGYQKKGYRREAKKLSVAAKENKFNFTSIKK